MLDEYNSEEYLQKLMYNMRNWLNYKTKTLSYKISVLYLVFLVYN